MTRYRQSYHSRAIIPVIIIRKRSKDYNLVDDAMFSLDIRQQHKYILDNDKKSSIDIIVSMRRLES